MSIAKKSIDSRCRLIERSLAAIEMHEANRDHWVNDLIDEAAEKGKDVLEGDQYRFIVLDGYVRVERKDTKKPLGGNPAA